jgi:transposase
VVIVLDNGPIHTSKATKAALAARAHWLSVEWLPKYAGCVSRVVEILLSRPPSGLICA